ncbi:MAG: DEAD/DEAH box helicase [Patescibacteria group bacterium]|nr:DEAD/DEAH box helicase [Patescibacteria group bacterium]
MFKEDVQQFDKMGLSPQILQGLNDLNFKQPTPIQSQAIPAILNSSNDLIGFAQTGTGKTAAFVLPILQQVDPGQRRVQAIILCPTRELCMQITGDIKHFAKHLPGIKTVAVYGGSSAFDQIRKLKDGAQIVVGTPGRVKDLLNRGKLLLGELGWLVLDEADEMLDKGFKEDLEAILDETPKKKQTLLFAATMSPWIKKVMQQRMNNPKEIRVAAQNQGADTVEHKYVTVHARDRYAALRRLLDVNPDVYGIVFCRTRLETKEVAAKLIEHNYSARAIHGDISQDERSETMARFREKHIQILVATDVAARGIDVNDLTHVINYELPDSLETYVHRSGRTGRAGKTGISLTVINMKERGKLKRIESMMKKRFDEINVPTGKEICEAQLMSLVSRVKNTEVDLKELDPYLPAIYEELKSLTYDQLIHHFVSVEFSSFLKHYSNSKDISTQRGYGQERGGQGYNGNQRYRDRKNIKLRTYRINFGKKDGFSPKSLFDMINKNQSLKGIEIGGIEVQTDCTQFEAEAAYHGKTIRFLGQEKYRKQQVKITAL